MTRVEKRRRALAALIEYAGGSAALFGHSSGAILALEAAIRGLPVSRLAVYEPPFVVGDGRPRPGTALFERLRDLVEQDRRDEAATLFLTEGAAAPAEVVEGMRAGETWGWFTGLAHTLPYDMAICGPGCALPAERLATITVPTLAIDGGESAVAPRVTLIARTPKGSRISVRSVMISRVLAADLPSRVGERVRIAGWLHRRRQLKSVTFLVVRDRSGLAQVVLTSPGAANGLTEETVVQVEGLVTASRQAPQGAELTEPVITSLSGPAAAPPVDVYRPFPSATLSTILDGSPVTLRHPRLRAPFEIAAASVAGFRAALDARAFTEIHTPKIVESATESGAGVFDIDYFGRRAYLAQSPQFFKQALVGVFERVYEVGPVFRAEPHDTARHLAQYTSLDAELGFIVDHHDVMAVLRDVLAGMVEAVTRKAAAAVELLGLGLPEVPARIPEIDFTDAQELLAGRSGEDPRGEPDLAPGHERWLSEWALTEHGSDFLYVTGYPLARRSFYTHPDPDRPAYSNGFDLLFRQTTLFPRDLHRLSP